MGYRSSGLSLMLRPQARSRILKKLSRAPGRDRAREGRRARRIEVWFADEARIAEEQITRRWAKRGTRPSAPTDQRTASAYIFGVICPKHGKGAAHHAQMQHGGHEPAPGRNRQSDRRAPRGASRRSGRLLSLAVSAITLIPLPAKCPELNRRKTSGSPRDNGPNRTKPRRRATARGNNAHGKREGGEG